MVLSVTATLSLFFSLSTSRRIYAILPQQQRRRRVHCIYIYERIWSDKRNMNMRNDIEEMIYFLLWISFALLLWMCTLQCTTFFFSLYIFKFIFIAACRHLNVCSHILLKHTKKKTRGNNMSNDDGMYGGLHWLSFFPSSLKGFLYQLSLNN